MGVAACQLSRALGLKVLGTAGTAEGMKLVLNNGAHVVFNHREEGYTEKILVQQTLLYDHIITSYLGASIHVELMTACVCSRRPQGAEVLMW